MRKRLFEIIEVCKGDDKPSRIYDIFMMLVIFISIIPLMFKENILAFNIIDKTSMVIFCLDYLFRLVTADYKLQKGKLSFFIYPLTFMAIVDLISILPSLSILSNGFKLFKTFRLLRTLRVFRVFKAFRYSKNIAIISNVFKEQKDSLIIVGVFSIGYIFVSALVIYNVEPETFENFFAALYWATVSLTTVGYGDIFATSRIGQIITMISSLLGVAIVALPAGIISAGYMKEINKKSERDNEDY